MTMKRVEHQDPSCSCGARGGDLLVRGGRVLTPAGFVEAGAVVIAAGRIAWVGAAAELPVSIEMDDARVEPAALPVLEAQGCTVAPGLLDVHTHGGGGADVMDSSVEALRTLARAHGRHGTTGLLATTVTAAQESLEQAATAVAEAMPASLAPDWGGAQILGLHLEGPYCSAGKRGAHHPGHLRPPDREELTRLIAILGCGFRLITLAPELPGALPVVRWLREQGVRVAIGHTEASYETALEAIAAGADHAVHAFNGMVPLHHREPGVLGALLSHDGITAELIADGIHVHPGAMKVLWKAKGPDLICLITDAIRAMDMPEGRYDLGGLAVEVRHGACRLVEGGALAGSILTLDRAVKNMVELVGVPLAEAIRLATAVPARQMGLDHCKGKLEVGYDGDLCVFGPDLLCRQTVVRGRILP
jgi:N-acetylglucosamine-6-phosphate deacetylase